ncbi:MAG: hypothetical protein HYV09_32805 [Deltaproteobacteria bacterium]|nr:hypothetical protein [Deltaproteobacteria bacterium]
MTTLRRSVALGALLLTSCAPGAIGCASDAPPKLASIGLAMTIPKALIDVDQVKLYVYDKDATSVACSGATITVPVDSAERVFELGLEKCNAGKGWCGTGRILLDPARVLTFYVEGRYTAAKGGFTGCVERAVDQDPLQLEMKAQPLIEGVKCGEGPAVGYGETCDPGDGKTVDEACDGTKCQTTEVVLSKGDAARGFYRGRPGRKTGIGVQWFGDKFYGVWSDGATNSGGNDGPNEINVRRTGADLVTETSPAVLSGEVRLPAGAGSVPNNSGTLRRGGVELAPTMVQIAADKLLDVFLRDDKVNAFVHDLRFNGVTDDAAVSPGGGAQSEPHAAAASSGDALIVFVEGGAVKSVLRKADGTLGGVQTVSTGGVASHPQAAWLGGDFVVAWSSTAGDAGDIKFRRVGADGSPKGTEDVVNKAKTAGKQDQPAVAAFPSGEFLVAWRDAAGDVAADIRVQKFDKTGAPAGAEIAQVLNDVTKDGDQDQPAVAAGTTRGGIRFYLVAWRTVGNIGARFVKADEQGFLVSHASATTGEFKAGVGARPRSSPAVAIGSAAPYCVIAWSDDADGDPAADDDRVRARRFPLPDPPK